MEARRGVWLRLGGHLPPDQEAPRAPLGDEERERWLEGTRKADVPDLRLLAFANV